MLDSSWLLLKKSCDTLLLVSQVTIGEHPTAIVRAIPCMHRPPALTLSTRPRLDQPLSSSVIPFMTFVYRPWHHLPASTIAIARIIYRVPWTLATLAPAQGFANTIPTTTSVTMGSSAMDRKPVTLSADVCRGMTHAMMASFAQKIFATRSTPPAAMSPTIRCVRLGCFAMVSTRHVIPWEAVKWSASVAQVSSVTNLPMGASIASSIPIAPTAFSVPARRLVRAAFAIMAPHLVAQAYVKRTVAFASSVLLMMIVPMMGYIAMASMFVLQGFARLGQILALLYRPVAKRSV